MATPITQLDRSSVRERVLEIVRSLLEELGSKGVLPMLNGESQFDRDLGIGSLERVELVARLELSFGVRIPDRIAAEANTPDAFASALLQSSEGDLSEPDEPSAFRTSVAVQTLHRQAADSAVLSAETLIDVIRLRAAHDAGRVHLDITEDSENGESSKTLTFGELHDAANRLAAELVRRGVPAGGRVGLMLPTSRAFFVSYAGILMAGAIPVPIYPPFRADRIEEYAARQAAILSNAEVCLLLTFRRAETVAKLLKPRVHSLNGVIDAEKLIEIADVAPPLPPGALPPHLSGSRVRKATDIALLQYTSGSTGDSKGVVLTHENLLANIRAIGEAVELGPGDVCVSWLPLYHDMGLIGTWLTMMHYGGAVAVMSPLAFLTRPVRWLQAFHKHRGTVSAAPNFAYELCVRKIADKDLQGIDLSSWRAALNGAEPINPETLQRFADRFAACGFRRSSQLPVYGLAEASLAVTIPPLGRGPLVDRIQREPFTKTGRAVPAAGDDATAISFVSSGKSVPRHDVRIVDDQGNEVEDRTEGFLWFRGASATRGYYKNEAATAKLFPQGTTWEGEYAWVDSGDRAYRVDGEFYITGRVKDIIIKGGRNLYPHEVEDLAAEGDGVRKGCVVAFGAKDEATGTEKLIVVAESREHSGSQSGAIVAGVTERVSNGLGVPPDRVVLVQPGSIPKTSSGKLRREETKRLFLGGTLGAGNRPVWLQVTRLGTTVVLQNIGHGLKRSVNRVLDFLYGIYFGVIFTLWIVPSWAIVCFYKDEKAAGRFTSSALKILFALLACRVRVVGREHMEFEGAKIFTANHGSYFDVLPLMMGLGVPYRFVAKMEVNKMPFIGTFLRKMGHLSFVREENKSRLRQAREIIDLLRAGESVFVFPEGTFAPEEGVRPFQLGAFKAAVQTGAPIIPISIAGARKVLRDGTILPRHNNITLTLSPPIYPRMKSGEAPGDNSASWQEVVRLRDATREAIAQYSGEPIL